MADVALTEAREKLHGAIAGYARVVRGAEGEPSIQVLDAAYSPVHKAIDALLAIVARDAEWQPMSSAPMDGTEILLCWEPEQAWKPADGYVVVLTSWRCRRHSYLSRPTNCPHESDCEMRWGAYGGRMVAWKPKPIPLPAPSSTQEPRT